MRALAIALSLVLAAGVPALAEGLTLRDSLQAALRADPELTLATEAAHQAELELGVAQSAYWPSLRAESQGLYRNLSAPSSLTDALATQPGLFETVSALGLAPGANLNVGLEARELLFDGATSARVDSASAQAAAARAQLEAKREAVLADTGVAYLELLAARSRLATAQRGVELAQSQLGLAQDRYRTGMGTMGELAQAAAHLAEAQAALAPAQRTQDAAWSELGRLTGLAPAELAEAPELPPLQLGADAIAQLVASAPSIEALRDARASAAAQARASARAGWPRLAATARYDRLVVQQVGVATAGVGLEWTPFDGGRQQLEAAIAASRARQAALQLDIAHTQALRAARQAYANWVAGGEARRAAAAALVSAQKDYHTAERRYAVGLGTQRDLFAAGSALLAAENGLTEARYGEIEAQLRLAEALGVPIARWLGLADAHGA